MPQIVPKSTKSTKVKKKKLTREERYERSKKKEGLPTNESIEEALRNTFGRISVAARALNFDRTTIHQRINKYPHLKNVVLESRNLVVPYAETKLMQNVANGDQRAIEFVLRNRGKGWNVNGEQEKGAGDLGVVINIFEAELEKSRIEFDKSKAIDITPNGDGSTNGDSSNGAG